MTLDRIWPLMEDDHLWKTTLIEDNLWYKITFDGRQILIEDNLWWKMTFDERRSLLLFGKNNNKNNNKINMNPPLDFTRRDYTTCK